MKSFVSAIILSAAFANSVTAGLVMPEGRTGLTQETMIGRSLAQPADLLQVGDDRVLHYYYGPKPALRSIVVPYDPRIPPLPATCQHAYFTADFGWATYFGARCLEETYRDAAYLPQACAATIRTEGRLRDVYDEYCLREAGYTVSGW